MPLHIDYRPQNFEEVFGNELLVKKLSSIFHEKREDKPRAILFAGPSGCGKTTLARIIAKELGCPEFLENGDRNLDFCEINSSNNRGIDTAREILEQIHYLPMNKESSCRIWLLDEVHQTTKDFQNALLKALEEPPKHIFFILCTTNPEKLLATIKTRCSKFEVAPLSSDDVQELIRWVLESEGLLDDFDDKIIAQIAEKVDGCPREALVALDQVIDLDAKDREVVISNYKTTEAQTIDLCRALMKKAKWPEVYKILDGLKQAGQDPENIRRAVIGYAAACMKNRIDVHAILIFECFKKNFFDTGWVGLIFASAEVVQPLKDVPY